MNCNFKSCINLCTIPSRRSPSAAWIHHIHKPMNIHTARATAAVAPIPTLPLLQHNTSYQFVLTCSRRSEDQKLCRGNFTAYRLLQVIGPLIALIVPKISPTIAIFPRLAGRFFPARRRPAAVLSSSRSGCCWYFSSDTICSSRHPVGRKTQAVQRVGWR